MAERYIYKSLRPFTLGLKPARARLVTDNAGNTRFAPHTKGVKVVFNNGTFEINESVAKSFGMTPKQMKKLMEENFHYGGRFKKVFDSTEETTKEQVEFSKKADAINKERGTKTTQGARAKKG